MKIEEKTLVIIKNDSIKRGLIGRIIQKFEDVGLEIIDMKMVRPSSQQAMKHYLGDREWKVKVGKRAIESFGTQIQAMKVLKTTNPIEVGEVIYKWSIEQLSKSKVVVMVLKGPNAVEKVKKIVGPGIPSESDLSTIRGMFSSDTLIKSNVERRALYNVVHRSSDVKEARREIKVWFSH